MVFENEVSKNSNSPENILTITLSDTIKIKISER